GESRAHEENRNGTSGRLGEDGRPELGLDENEGLRPCGVEEPNDAGRKVERKSPGGDLAGDGAESPPEEREAGRSRRRQEQWELFPGGAKGTSEVEGDLRLSDRHSLEPNPGPKAFRRGEQALANERQNRNGGRPQIVLNQRFIVTDHAGRNYTDPWLFGCS